MSPLDIQSDRDWRKLRHAQSRFSLEPEDLQQFPNILALLLSSDDNFDAFETAVKENTVLSAISLRNAYKKIGRDVRNVENSEEFAELVELYRTRIDSTFKDVKTFLQGLYPFEVEEARPDRIAENRRDTLERINSEYGDVTGKWQEPVFALNDEAMSKTFKSRGRSSNRFLTTYFDSARVGLVNRPLQEAVDEDAYRQKENWIVFKERMQEFITSSFDAGYSDVSRQRFFPDNCFFQFNGTEAFMLFRRNFMKEGEKVLATHEEYSENIQDMRQGGLAVTQLDDYSNEAEFLSALRKSLAEGAQDYLLVSSVSRFGNVNPLEAINEIRREVSPETKLIVDACQSAGRMVHDMNHCGADAVIMSTTKGSELGQGLGVLLVAGAAPRKETKDLNGSAPPENLARTAYALNPEAMDFEEMKLDPEIRKLVLSPHQRAQALSCLSHKFFELSSALNDRNGDRIDIINPKNTSNPAHAIEFRIRGVNRHDLCRHLGVYGIYVDAEYTDPHDDESIRIAFHPYMNDEAIKILCGALEDIIQET